ncbi:MAG: hypothetical protein AAFZ15_04955 [Bacteroidota bacterium]
MNRRKFSFQLLLLTVVLTGVVMSFQLIPALSPFIGFYLISIGFFCLLSLVMFFTSAKAAISKDKNAFTRLIMVFTMAKLFLTVIIVVVYQQIEKPDNVLFILPFFAIYIAYTIFETIFMTKLGKVEAR